MVHADRLPFATLRPGFDFKVYRGVIVVSELRLRTPLTITHRMMDIGAVRVEHGTTLVLQFDHAVQVAYELGPPAAAEARALVQELLERAV